MRGKEEAINVFIGLIDNRPYDLFHSTIRWKSDVVLTAQ